MRACIAAAGLFIWLSPPSAAANGLAFERLADTVRASAFIPNDLIERATANCATALCFAKALTKSLPERLRLELIDHPDTDTIRWADTVPSVDIQEPVNAEEGPGDSAILRLKLSRFGRKAVSELRAALAEANGREVVLDLRGNTGGDFERMLEIAGILIGPVRNALEIDDRRQLEQRSLEGPASRSWQVDQVLVDDQTASAALLLARLLEAYAGTELDGPSKQNDPIFLKRRITIDHNWRLIFPIAELGIAKP